MNKVSKKKQKGNQLINNYMNLTFKPAQTGYKNIISNNKKVNFIT